MISKISVNQSQPSFYAQDLALISDFQYYQIFSNAQANITTYTRTLSIRTYALLYYAVDICLAFICSY